LIIIKNYEARREMGEYKEYKVTIKGCKIITYVSGQKGEHGAPGIEGMETYNR
jgi:hypothetical protein